MCQDIETNSQSEILSERFFFLVNHNLYCDLTPIYAQSAEFELGWRVSHLEALTNSSGGYGWGGTVYLLTN